MSNLHEAAVKSILNAVHSTNLTIESFIIGAISTVDCMNHPLSRSFLDGGIKTLLDNLLQDNSTSFTVSNWAMGQAVGIYKKHL